MLNDIKYLAPFFIDLTIISNKVGKVVGFKDAKSTLETFEVIFGIKT